MLRTFKLGIQLIGACLVFTTSLYAQKDTVRILDYNLLNYGSSEGPASYKNPRLATILKHTAPDIFGVNELSYNRSNAQNVIDNALGSNWSKASYLNTNNEFQTNTLFWRSDKFALKSEQVISANLRDIIAYTLYYKDAALDRTHDTIFLTIILVHLKASNTDKDAQERAAESQTIVDYFKAKGKAGNYIVMGDFNVYTSSEPAYTNLVNNPASWARMYDPINRPGDWAGDRNFAAIHTQSTRTTNLPDGGVGGGLDDRFDQILVSGHIMGDSSRVKYLPGSYTTVGQDGNHFNRAVNASPDNNSAPAAVIQALYEMSDHLPVYADFVLSPAPPPATGIASSKLKQAITVINPFHNQLSLRFDPEYRSSNCMVAVYSMSGERIYKQLHTIEEQELSIPIDEAKASGWYILNISDENGASVSLPVLKY